MLSTMSRRRTTINRAALPMLGYVRVSTNRQEIGPEVQIASLQAEAERNGWTLEIRREDAASAKSMRNRPVLAQALADLRAGRARGMVVAKLDRLSRDVADFSGMLNSAERERWDFVALDLGIDTSTITGRAMAQVTATFAEMERRRIAERTREAMAKLSDEQRDRMRQSPGRPRSLSPETEELVKSLKAEGMSLAAIARKLNADGVPSATGGKWYPSTVKQVAER